MAKAQTAAPLRAPSAHQATRGGRKSDLVFEQISLSIRSGRLPAGSRLPAERDLVTMFNASRQTIREAIYRAELVGLIEVRHGAGSFVVSAVPTVGEKAVDELIKMEAGKVGEFFEIRRALEGWCAGQAAKAAGQPASKPHLATMKARLDAMMTLDVNSDAWEENDIDFHAAMAAATGNPLAMRMLEIMRDSFNAFYRLKRYIPNHEERALIWRHHADVYEAVAGGSPGRAQAAILAHMDFVEDMLAESLEEFDARQD